MVRVSAREGEGKRGREEGRVKGGWWRLGYSGGRGWKGGED